MESNLGPLQMLQTLTVMILSFAIHSLFITPDSAFALGPGELEANELLSSRSPVAAMKKSSVWLHWNYTYFGDFGSTITYKEQIIGCNSSSQPFQPLAKRTGANGALTVVSSLPAHFSGRIEVIPANSTLVIKNLQLNDSSFSFSSYVARTLQGAPNPSITDLKPAVRITVQGVPEFTGLPPSAIEVDEGTSVTIAVEMNGNPQPSVDFSWPHLGQAPTNLPSKEIYPHVFSSTYKSPGLDASFCGRYLMTLAKNGAGSSPSQLTNVTVLLKLEIDPKLEAGKIADQRCVEVKWDKAESGLCFVKYEVKFKNASGNNIYTEIGYNINSKKKCSIPGKINITNVELTMSFKTSLKTVTVRVSENPIPTTAAPTTAPTTTQTTKSNPDSNTPGTTKTTHSLSSSSDVSTVRTVSTTASKDPGKQTGPSTGVIVGATFGGVIFLILIILLVLFLVKRSKRNQKKEGSGESEYQLQDNKMDNPYAMAGNPKQDPYEPAYADPKAQTVTYGKLGPGGGRKGPRPAKREDVSDYADVKVDEHGYPAIGAMPVSYTDGYGESNRSGVRGERDSGRRVAPDRRPPPPYNDSNLDDDGYPVSKNQPPIYAQVNKKR